MPTPFTSARHQAALGTRTGYRRWSQFTFTRDGVSRVIEPVSATLTQDSRRSGRWDGQLSFVGSDLLPRRPSDILTPFGTRVTVELGVELLDGSVSTVPYGVYEVGSSKGRSDPGSRVVDVPLIDVSGAVERYRFETPFTVPAATDLASMVNQVVTNRVGINPGVGATGSSLGVARVFGLDTETAPWSELLDVLDGFSRTAWYDRSGQIQVGTTTIDPDNSTPLDDLTSTSVAFDTKPPNVIVARGEAQDGTAPVQAVAMDTEPSSPTFAGTGPGTSPYGRVTMFFSSPLITTLAQAQSAANTLLANNIGAGATHTITRPYDPTLSAGDVVAFDGVTYVVDSITLDLLGQTTMSVRELG